MSNGNHIRIETGVEIPGEEVFLNNVVDNLGDEAHLNVYADWLEERGDANRAAFLRKYAAAFLSMNPENFPEFEGMPKYWLRLTGAPIVRAIAQHGLIEHRDQWLPFAKPALLYEANSTYNDDLSNDKRIPVGSTKIHGLPDMPPGTPWPLAKDCNCKLYDEPSDIPPELPCSFIAQINVAELAGTQFARQIPSQGLISIFSCTELEKVGFADALVMFFPDTTNLVRHEAPESLGDDEANAILDAQENLTLSETLALPSSDDSSVFEAFRWAFNDELEDPYDQITEDALARELNSIGGYTRPTTGSDHLPGPDWIKLIFVENTVEIGFHLCIPAEDLAQGIFDNVKMSWIDMG